MKTILVIDDEKSIRKILSIALQEKGYEVFEATNGREGLEVFKDKKPEIVITDVKMPEMSGIQVTREIKRLNDDVDVIIITGYGSEDLVIESLRVGASNFIKKPILLAELYKILEDIVLKRESKKRLEVAKDVVIYEKKKCVIGNDIKKIWSVVNQILFNISPFFEKPAYEGLRIGLYEIIINAIEHGNLGISYNDKNKALNSNTYMDLLNEKIKIAEEKGKKVEITSTFEENIFEIEVKDDGDGFDYESIPSPNDPDKLLEAHGRGVFLTSIYFDEIKYMDPGNRVILKKQITRLL